MRFRIDNLPNDATENDIRQLFSGYGNVLWVTLLPGPVHSKQLGSGLIELDNVDIRDCGGFPDHCLFKGTVIRVTQDRSTAESRSPDTPSTPGVANEPALQRTDNRSRNVLHVISIEEVLDPATGKADGWCRYSIQSLAGAITGLRHGSVAEVTLYAEEAAEAFNLRNMLGQQRPPIWTSRGKK